MAQDCGPELRNFCGDVTGGGGRKIACLFAYHDKLPVHCALTLHQATGHAENAMATMRRVVNRCIGDVDRYCSRIVPGQGRIALCLLANKPKLSKGCRNALGPLGR